MFHRRGFVVAAGIGAVVLFGAGCEDSAAKKGSAKPAGATGSASPTAAQAVMPSLVGQKSVDAEAAVVKLTRTPVELRSAYANVPLAADHSQWSVCFQTPAAGTVVNATVGVELSETAPGTACPERAGATLQPSKSAKPTSAPTSATPKSTPTKGGSAGGGSVHYKNCDAAKAAGAAPIRRGQPGYGKHLDRDNDGIACDK
uniref:Excalibur calcium-binding domain-containing protein n=1 Tax=Streptomyces sp. NBC_00049 TaxID=2903617 RepID=A0AAU2JV52_9ACTN